MNFPSTGSRKDLKYKAIINKIFSRGYTTDSTGFTFHRDTITRVCEELEIKRPGNLGDVPYHFRYRQVFPDEILATQPENKEWILKSVGRSLYEFRLVNQSRIVPRSDITPIRIRDCTPQIVKDCAMNDEQALLAMIRYNQLIGVFLDMPAYTLQNHLRTTVTGIGQIEIDELYVGRNEDGDHIIPVQAKRGNDKIGVVQTTQDIAFCRQRFSGKRCRALSMQFIGVGDQQRVAVFELTVVDDTIHILDEKHYQFCQTGPAALFAGTAEATEYQLR